MSIPLDIAEPDQLDDIGLIRICQFDNRIERHQRWEGQAGTVGMLGISPFFFMGVGVML